MNWWWWRRKGEGDPDRESRASEAERRATTQYRRAQLQGGRVDRAIDAAQDATRQLDQLAREYERAMRPRGI